MANADTPHGFTPMRHLTGGIIRANEYEIANGEADSFSFGDIVQLDSDGFLDAFANSENAIGVFYGVQYTDDTTGDVKFERKWTGGSTFKVQAGGAAIAQANVGELCNVILTAGDATFLNSKHEADMSTLANTAKVLRILRIVDEPGNEIAENAEIEVVINNHLFGTQNAGI